MTYQEIYQMVQSFGFPCAYYQFKDKTDQAPPFVLFVYEESNDFLADDSNYQKIEALTIELYTRDKDFEAEATIENILKQNDMVYARTDDFMDSERLHITTYTMEVLING